MYLQRLATITIRLSGSQMTLKILPTQYLQTRHNDVNVISNFDVVAQPAIFHFHLAELVDYTLGLLSPLRECISSNLQPENINVSDIKNKSSVITSISEACPLSDSFSNPTHGH